jgi:uncharacterized protein
MKWVLIGVIHLYRQLPPFFKRKCLFKNTCSSHVLQTTRASGFYMGLRSLRLRMFQCRPGYVVFFDNEKQHWAVRFANGSVANSDELADFILAPTLELMPGTITF